MTLMLLFVGGLAFGSFVNAFVWRLHQLSSKKKLSKKQKRELSVVRGRSMCTHCRHELAWYDLLPVVSWLLLKGRCRYCKHPIGRQYPVVELMTGLLFAGSYQVWPYGFEPEGVVLFGLWLVFVAGFSALTVYDLRWMLLPNKIVYGLIGLALTQTAVKLVVYSDRGGVLTEAFLGFLTIGGVFYVLFQVSRGRWIGGGDVKLGFLIGILVGGPLNSLLVIFLASMLGTLVALPFILTRSLKATSRIPFGPFLLAATLAVYLSGDRIADWYVRTFIQIS